MFRITKKGLRALIKHCLYVVLDNIMKDLNDKYCFIYLKVPYWIYLFEFIQNILSIFNLVIF